MFSLPVLMGFFLVFGSSDTWIVDMKKPTKYSIENEWYTWGVLETMGLQSLLTALQQLFIYPQQNLLATYTFMRRPAPLSTSAGFKNKFSYIDPK